MRTDQSSRLQRSLIKAVAAGSVVATIAVPLSIGAVQAVVDKPHVAQAFIASAVGALFMASTAFTAAVLMHSRWLRPVVLVVYIWKCSLLVWVGLSIDLPNLHAPTMAIGIGLGAFVVIAAEVLALASATRGPKVSRR